MFLGTHPSEPSKFITIHLSSENYDLSVRPTPPLQNISSFLTWTEAWNIYLAILIDHAPACAPQLVVYQRIITSASNQYSLAAWLNYDTHFCTLAALDPSLRCYVRLTDLWLECFSGTSAPMIRWPCVHCGATTHYPENCLFRAQSMFESPRGQHPSPASTSTVGQHPPPTLGNVSQPGQPSDSRPTWHSQAAKGHDGLAMPSTVQSAVILPATSYTCVNCVVPTTVPSSAPTGTVPITKPTPWTPL